MKNLKIILLFVPVLLFAFSSCAKDEKAAKIDAISFEDIPLDTEGINNGSDGSGGFTSGNVVFKTNYSYDETYNFVSWSGFAVSNHTDTITSGIINQYSSIAGSGAGPSEKYAVLYSTFSYTTAPADTIEFLIPAKVTNIGVSNSTYAYYSMKNGDQFCKKFGGVSGNDPDFFYLYLSAITAKGQRMNFNPIPLADFTNTNGEPDFIKKGWDYYNLSKVGYIKYLIFSFASSDTSAYGINTPTYVCIDNLVDEWQE